MSSPGPKHVLRVSEAVEFTRDTVLEVDWIQLKRALTSKSRDAEAMRTPRAAAQLQVVAGPESAPGAKVRVPAGAAPSHAAANAAAVAAALAMVVKVDSDGYGPTVGEQSQLADPFDAAEGWHGLGPGEAEDDEEMVHTVDLVAWSIPPDLPPDLPPTLPAVPMITSWRALSEATPPSLRSPRVRITGDVKRPQAQTALEKEHGAVRTSPRLCRGDSGVLEATPCRLRFAEPETRSDMPVLLGTTAPMYGDQHVKGRINELPKVGMSVSRGAPSVADTRSSALGLPGTSDSRLLAAFLAQNGFAGPTTSRRRRFKTDYPLHVAVQERDPQMVQLLLFARADPMQKNGEGQTAEEFARSSSKDLRRTSCLRACAGRVHDPSKQTFGDVGTEGILQVLGGGAMNIANAEHQIMRRI